MGDTVNEVVRSLDLGNRLTQTQLLPESNEDREQRRLKAIEAQTESDQRLRDNDWVTLMRDIGRRYIGCRLGNFEANTDAQKSAIVSLNTFCEEIKERTEAGQGLVFTGPKGTGKDHLAVACLRVAVLHQGIKADWVDGQSLYQEFRDNIDSESSELQMVRQYTAPKILLISDPVPHTDSLTAFQQSVLWRIIDRRYRNMTPTWVTMNVATAEEAEKRIGSQIVDRLRDGALSIVCNWPSHRRKADQP